MKVVNKIMIGIAVLCLLLCGGILVFALNPDMTSSLAQKLYGNTVDMPPGTEETGEGQTSGNGNISVTLPNGMPGEMNGYVAPSMDQMQIPEDVSGRTGFTPVQPEEQQIPDQEAQNLKETLGSGETGEGLSFSAEEYPYYQMLSENQQSVYRQIYANAQNLTEKFAPEKTVSASDVKTAFEAVIGDHPEMFWLETGYSSKYLANGQCVEIDLKYNGTADDLESAKQRFDAAAQNLITGAASLDSNYEKEKYVHDALASAVTYDLTADMNQSAYSALVNGKSVCAGYARAYQYLLQQLGIPCYYCTGYSGGDHAWNIVKLEDGYYKIPQGQWVPVSRLKQAEPHRIRTQAPRPPAVRQTGALQIPDSRETVRRNRSSLAALSVIISIRILRSRCVIPPAIPQALQAIPQLPLRRSPEPMR